MTNRKPAQKGFMPSRMVIAGTAIISVLAFIVFSPALTADFLSWDDYNYIKDNALIRSFTLQNILHIFHYKTIVVGNYHPLTVMSYVIEYQVAGINPFIYHFDNLLLHVFNIALVSWAMWLLTRKQWATLIAVMLFAVHPMRVESVVWAAERKDVLYTFFFLLAFICYIYSVLKEKNRTRYYLLSILCFILSILSKGQAVVLPLTLFLVDYWFQKKIGIRSVINKLPYLALALASGILAMVAQHSSLTEQRLGEHSLLERLGFATFSVTAYLYKLVFPFNLSAFYKYPASSDLVWVWAGALAGVIILVVAIIFLRKHRPVVFGGLFYLFTISIVSQILPVGNAIMADRYTYIPYFGLFFIIAYYLDQMIAAKGPRQHYFIILPLAFLVIFSIKSYTQSLTWQNNFSIWENAISQDPHNGVAYTNLGREYLDKEDYKTAEDLFRKAIANEDTFIEVYHAYQNLGVTFSKTGKYEEAIKWFDAGLKKRPNWLEAIFSRGLSRTSLGQYDLSVADFTTILTSIDSLHIKSYYSRGIAYNKMGKPDLAVADYTTAIRIDPQYSDAYVNRGNIYYAKGQFEAALADYTKALSIIPEDGNCLLNRSFVYFRMQRFSEALSDALRARDLKMEVNPNYLADLQRLSNRK